eukprot:GILJ01003938.1.p1 GENE.GILJ01003938.1~~GILJ01003938.1.p1  ORF type:complete len:163 (-),score=21.29 GILJ01003938.1:219-674(-)
MTDVDVDAELRVSALFQGPINGETISREDIQATPVKRQKLDTQEHSSKTPAVLWTPTHSQPLSSNSDLVKSISRSDVERNLARAIGDRNFLLMKTQLACLNRDELEDVVIDMVCANPYLYEKVRERWSKSLATKNLAREAFSTLQREDTAL